jgi:hypothetical protein
MEPLKPETRKEILRKAPGATVEELAEYERLLSERFTIDPDAPRSPSMLRLQKEKQNRLKELYKKLFPGAEAGPVTKGKSTGRR